MTDAETGSSAAERTGSASTTVTTGDDRPAVWSRVGVTAIFFLNGGAFATWAARVPAVQQALGLSAGQLALGLLGLSIGSVVGLVGTGVLTARMGSKVSAFAGLAALCAGLPLISLAGSPLVLIGVLALFGLGHSILDVAMNAQAIRVAKTFPRSILGSIHASWSLGGLAGALTGTWFAAHTTNLSAHFTSVTVAIAVLGFAGCVAFLPGLDAAVRGRSWPKPSPALLVLGVIAVCAFIGEGTVNDWSAVYLSQAGVASPAVASLGFAAFALAMALGRLGSDQIVHRIGRAWVIRAASVTTTAGLGAALVFPAPPWGVIAFGVFGLGLSAIIPIVFTTAGELSDGPPGPAISLISTLGYFGFLAGPVVVGTLAEYVGLRMALPVILVLTMALLALAPYVAERRH